jgi:hypothetical protein
MKMNIQMVKVRPAIFTVTFRNPVDLYRILTGTIGTVVLWPKLWGQANPRFVFFTLAIKRGLML